MISPRNAYVVQESQEFENMVFKANSIIILIKNFKTKKITARDTTTMTTAVPNY